MRALLRLILAFWLCAGLAGGTVLHAAEQAGESEITALMAGQHIDGDHDPAPDDTDQQGYPHHHSICHGHDLTSAARTSGPGVFARLAPPRPAADTTLAAGPPGALLRPPRA